MEGGPADLATNVEAEVPDMTEALTSLSAVHRCDRCGAQAFVVTRHEAGDLLWCAHHFHEREDILGPLKVLDESDKINTSASPSAY